MNPLLRFIVPVSQLFADLAIALKKTPTDLIMVGVVSYLGDNGKIRCYLGSTGLQTEILEPVGMVGFYSGIIVDETQVLYIILESNGRGYWLGMINPPPMQAVGSQLGAFDSGFDSGFDV